MSFLSEFKNVSTGLMVTETTEFVDADSGAQFLRLNGSLYVKNSEGYFDVGEAIPNLKIYDVDGNVIFP